MLYIIEFMHFIIIVKVNISIFNITFNMHLLLRLIQCLKDIVLMLHNL